MELAGTASRRFPSKFLLTVIPGLVASGVAASVLYAVHVSRAPAVSEYLSEPTPQSDGLSAEERRDLTRQMMRSRRENPETPAAVLPVPPPGAVPMDGDATLAGADVNKTPDGARVSDAKIPDTKIPDTRVPDASIPDAKAADFRGPDTRTPDTKAADANAADVKTADVKTGDVKTGDVKTPDLKTPDVKAPDIRMPDVRTGSVAKAAPDRPAPPPPDHVIVTAPLPAPRPSLVRRYEPPAAPLPPAQQLPPPPVTTAAVPPPAMSPPGGPLALSGPRDAQVTAAGQQPPMVTAAVPPPPPPQHRGFGANVLSGLSTMAGSAANATGNTVNWVINLPGKAIHAGGKLIGIPDSRKADDQASPPPPGAAPPPATAPPPASRF